MAAMPSPVAELLEAALVGELTVIEPAAMEGSSEVVCYRSVARFRAGPGGAFAPGRAGGRANERLLAVAFAAHAGDVPRPRSSMPAA